MEAAGVISRNRSRKDEREVEVRLTERGLALREEAIGVRAGIVCRLGMDEQDIVRLRRDIDLVIERLSGEPPAKVR